MTPQAEQVMWIAEDGPAYREGHSGGCVLTAIEGQTLPKGLRGVAKPAREACGPGWYFVRFDVPRQPSARTHNYYVPAAALTVAAPKPAFDKSKATGEAYTRQAGDAPTLAIPLDNPDWTTPALLPGGELVERLDGYVIRTASGHELWVDPFYLGEADPLGRSDYSASAASVPLRRRFVAGLAAREAKASLTWLPPAAELGAAQKGNVYAFRLRPEWLSAPRFTPEWFDPVGQSIEHPCDKNPRSDEPCGSYTLDYAAFGAWLPTTSYDVVAMWNGRSLEVMATDPWGDKIAVSPAWDGQ